MCNVPFAYIEDNYTKEHQGTLARPASPVRLLEDSMQPLLSVTKEGIWDQALAAITLWLYLEGMVV
jgi:hypothetical protein